MNIFGRFFQVNQVRGGADSNLRKKNRDTETYYYIREFCIYFANNWNKFQSSKNIIFLINWYILWWWWWWSAPTVMLWHTLELLHYFGIIPKCVYALQNLENAPTHISAIHSFTIRVALSTRSWILSSLGFTMLRANQISIDYKLGIILTIYISRAKRPLQCPCAQTFGGIIFSKYGKGGLLF